MSCRQAVLFRQWGVSAYAAMCVSMLGYTLPACSGDSEASPGSNFGGNTATAGGHSSGGSSPSAGSTGHAGSSSAVAGTTGQQSSGGANGNAGTTSTPEGGALGGGEAGPVACRSKGDGKSTISFVNQCDAPLSFRGSKIEGGELGPGEHACRDVGNTSDEIPAIRFWGFMGMDPGGEKYTLAELTLNTTFNDFDWYNISHVDAHNLPMRVVPVDMPSCRVLTCAESLLASCPAVGQLKDESGKLISCVSPARDDPNSVVAQYFEASCKDAYSWSGDDSESVAACAGEDYDVVFCP